MTNEPSSPEFWMTAQVAAFLGIKPASVRRGVERGSLPQPDGHLSSRFPWWKPETIRNHQRPGRGARTDLVQQDGGDES
ncbi:MarR family transcriptional regulator [Streptomyces scabiei]|uniref:MarR family transcriptional regulator n=1 Tax=Streptomyces scabiei TaxID=1930 RepID=UPI00378BFC10